MFSDKPGKPEGPIDIKDVTPDSCVLSWKPPKVKKYISCLFMSI